MAFEPNGAPRGPDPIRARGRVLAAIAVGCLLQIGAALPVCAAPVRRALFIAINRYASPNVPPLLGPHNDVVMMRKVLAARYGFQESEMVTILDEQASRAGILAALRDLARTAAPEDVVYLHYSGHGSQVRDQDGDEPDGLDETLVPYDGRTGDVPDVTDDELAEILAGLKPENALIILDSCHSGTATRSVAIRTRSIPTDTRANLYVRPRSRAVVPVAAQRYVLMTGASAAQSALDGPIDGQSRGFFSYALGRVLSSAAPGVSSEQIHTGIKVEFRSLQEQFGAVDLPEPQVEGTPSFLVRAVLGTTAVTNADGAIAAPAVSPQPDRVSVEVRQAERGSLLLVDGLAQGAAPGSRWAIYPRGERAFESDRAMATARVVEVRGRDALAVTEPAGAGIDSVACAILISTAPPAKETPVSLSAPEELAAGLRTGIQQRMGGVRFVGPQEFARFIVEVAADPARSGSLVVNVHGSGGLELLTSFAWSDAAQASDRLVAQFSRSANAGALKSLSNPSSRMKLGVKLVAAGPGGSGSRGVSVIPAGNDVRYRIRKPEEPRTSLNSLMLEIDSDRDCYLTIVDVDAEGGVTVLFPNAQQSAGFLPEGGIRAREIVRIPDSLAEPNRAGFFWDYSPPAGPDVIQVFATTDLESTQRLRAYIEDFRSQGGARAAPAAAGRSVSPASDPLDRLRAELANLATHRGVRVTGSKPASPSAPAAAGSPAAMPGRLLAAEWTSVPLTIEVRE